MSFWPSDTFLRAEKQWPSEFFLGWLEYLLERIHIDRKTIAIPVITTISFETFEFSSPPTGVNPQVGGFDWRMAYVWNRGPKNFEL